MPLIIFIIRFFLHMILDEYPEWEEPWIDSQSFSKAIAERMEAYRPVVSAPITF